MPLACLPMPPMPAREGEKAVLLAAASVVLFAGLRFASPFLVPFLLAAFVAIATTPLVAYLEQKRLPRTIAVAVGLGVDLMLMFGLAALLARSLQALAERLPVYEPAFRTAASRLAGWLWEFGFEVEMADLRGLLDPNAVVKAAGAIVQSTAFLLSQLAVVTILLAFILFEAAGTRETFARAFGTRDERAASASRVRTYLLVKTATSAATGVFAGLLCYSVGLELPLLWGLLAYLLNYIPTIGSLIAALPAIALASLQLGLLPAAGLTAGYFFINLLIGNVLEPRFMGQALGLRPLVVLLSMLFWGFLLGPVGALFSAPLSMLARDWLLNTVDLKWLGELMGNPDSQIVVMEPE